MLKKEDRRARGSTTVDTVDDVWCLGRCRCGSDHCSPRQQPIWQSLWRAFWAIMGETNSLQSTGSELSGCERCGCCCCLCLSQCCSCASFVSLSSLTAHRLARFPRYAALAAAALIASTAAYLLPTHPSQLSLAQPLQRQISRQIATGDTLKSLSQLHSLALDSTA